MLSLHVDITSTKEVSQAGAVMADPHCEYTEIVLWVAPCFAPSKLTPPTRTTARELGARDSGITTNLRSVQLVSLVPDPHTSN